MASTRCKFTCRSVTDLGDGYECVFEAVTCGSKENDKFFNYTLSGQLTLSVVRDKSFEENKEYYIDIHEA